MKQKSKTDPVRKRASGKNPKSKSETQVEGIENKIEQTLAQLSTLNSELVSLTSAADGSGVFQGLPPLDTIYTQVNGDIVKVEGMLALFQETFQDMPTLTGTERRRLFGVRSRMLGFITQAYSIEVNNTKFATPNFSPTDMADRIRLMELARQLTMLLEQYHRVADDVLLLLCDDNYRDALAIYRNLQAQSRRGVKGAEELYLQLRQFFTLHRRGRNAANGNGEPTDKEILRDAKRLLHGQADGAVMIANASPRTTAGVREVIDDVR